MPTIPALIASHVVFYGHDVNQNIRAMEVAERAINRLPNQDSANMPGIVTAYNIAYLTNCAISSRLDGDIHYALRCEVSRDRLLKEFNL